MQLTINFPQSKFYSGWLTLHKCQGGWDKTPPGMPQVMPPLNPLSVTMTEIVQRISFTLANRKNKLVTPWFWTRAHDTDRVMTNEQGFQRDGDEEDQRANYITGDHVNKGFEDPKYDKSFRTSGGNFIRGVQVGDLLRCTAGVHGLDASSLRPASSFVLPNGMVDTVARDAYVNAVVDKILAENWYISCTQIYHRDDLIGYLEQGQGKPFLFPFIFNRTIEFEIKYFAKWEKNFLPDVLTIYDV